MNKRNYQKELDSIIEGIRESGERPSLLLHSCCAPCSSYPLKYLSAYFDITDLYYNPNISDETEYKKRAGELRRLVDEYNRELCVSTGSNGTPQGHISIDVEPFTLRSVNQLFQGQNPLSIDKEGYRRQRITYIEEGFEPAFFFEKVKGLEDAPEGGERCYVCYEMRMRRAASLAREKKMDYYTTTLSISPLKNAEWINEIGERLSIEFGVKHLPSDFKKKDGYKASIELSRKYGLYRQDYCGCVFSKRDRDLRNQT